MKTVILIVLLIFQFSSIYSQEQNNDGLREKVFVEIFERFEQYNGKKLPDMALLNINGNINKLSDFNEKLILLDFWSTWCKPCVASIPDQKEIRQRLIKNGVQDFIWINISVDHDTTAWENMVTKKQIPNINLIGTRKDIENSFNIDNYPTLILVNNKLEVIGFDIATPDWGPLLEYLIVQGLEGVKSSVAFQKTKVTGKSDVTE
jgi:thiol-disulfide isomerase/thioredoxin